MKFYELQEKMQDYEIMQSIAKEYKTMIRRIDNEKDYFNLFGIRYAARSDLQNFELNNIYAPFPTNIFRDGLQAALDKLEKDIAELENELKEWL